MFIFKFIKIERIAYFTKGLIPINNNLIKLRKLKYNSILFLVFIALKKEFSISNVIHMMET
jgi:hypothetical protein